MKSYECIGEVTVSELIDKLKLLDQESIVCIFDESLNRVVDLELMQSEKNGNKYLEIF